MFNICPACGAYTPDKKVVHTKPKSRAICPDCGHAHSFLGLPILFLTGPSGVGKSTIGLMLQQSCPDVVVMESDLFWIAPLQNETTTRTELMLRVAKNIMQAGKPVLMVGVALPQHFAQSIEKRYFLAMHYLALTSEDAILRKRLQARPEWRQCGTEAFIQPQLQFNQWLKENAANRTPPIQLLDNGNLTIDKTHQLVLAWIKETLQKEE